LVYETSLLRKKAKIQKKSSTYVILGFLSKEQGAENDKNDEDFAILYEELHSVVTFVDKVYFVEVKIFQPKKEDIIQALLFFPSKSHGPQSFRIVHIIPFLVWNGFL